MYERHCSSIVIVESRKPIGIWTEADSLKVDILDVSQFTRPISQVMTEKPFTIRSNISLDEAATLLKKHGVRHLIVVDDQGYLCGIASQSDVIVHQDAKYFLSMTPVSAVLPDKAFTKRASTSMLNQIIQDMQTQHLDALVICNNEEPVGVITERDIVRLIAGAQANVPVEQVMSKPIIAVPASMSLLAVRSFMEKRHVRHIGVKCEQGKLLGIVSFSDILNRIEKSYIDRLRGALAQSKENVKEHQRSLHLAHALIEASADGIMVTDGDAKILSVNPAFTILTGYSEEEALGKSAGLISSGLHDTTFYQEMWQSIGRNGKWQGEIWNRRKSGEIYPEWLTITRVKERSTDRVMYAGIFSDISERKKTERMIEHLAYYDPLTKLPNRQLLIDRLDTAIAECEKSQQLAVLFIDIDNFKRINDSLGHTFGDEVLRQVAKRLQSQLASSDTLARLGGDELILMMPSLHDPAVVYRIAQSLIDALVHPFTVLGRELFITVSIGCAIYPQDGINREELLKNADTAMYRAKSDGRNRVSLYCAEMNEQSQVQLAFENRLRHALSNDEFYLVYQPKVDVGTQRVGGVEALIRWRDKELGVVAPDRFIGLAEDIGLISKIGYWVMEQAMLQALAWQKLGGPLLVISVNVSVKQFANQDLPRQIEALLKSTGLEAKYFDVEVTESHVMTNFESFNRDLAAIRALGVTVSMDDFGTGYSSLSMLTKMPLDNLKIDRSFMEGIPGSKENEVLVSTIILMAKNLSLNVVAEGVESAEQLAFLSQLGCQQIQGYFYSKPLNAALIPEFINQASRLKTASLKAS